LCYWKKTMSTISFSQCYCEIVLSNCLYITVLEKLVRAILFLWMMMVKWLMKLEVWNFVLYYIAVDDDRTRFWGKRFYCGRLHLFMGILLLHGHSYSGISIQWTNIYTMALQNFIQWRFFLMPWAIFFWGFSLLYKGVSFINFVGQFMLCWVNLLGAISGSTVGVFGLVCVWCLPFPANEIYLWTNGLYERISL